MVAINLTATGQEQELIKAYLQENAGEILADKINNGTPLIKDGISLINRKTIDGFMKFACEEARKLAAKGANSACIEDKTVYGWAVHYFEEDSIEGTLYNADGTEYKPAKPKVTAKKTVTPVAPPKPQPKSQFSLFDLMDDKPDEPQKPDVQIEDDDDDYPSEEEQQEILRELAEEEAKLEGRNLPNPEPPKGSPLYLKYTNIQNRYPDSIVAMRLGDFYEVFGDNAVTLANELDLTLTGRDCGLESRVPMIGFPYHAAEKYFSKIIANHTLAIVETDTDIRQMPKPNIDVETGEILSEEEMQKFDGDIYEPKDLPDDELLHERQIAKAYDKETLRTLSAILGDIFIVR